MIVMNRGNFNFSIYKWLECMIYWRIKIEIYYVVLGFYKLYNDWWKKKVEKKFSSLLVVIKLRVVGK